MTNTSLIIIIKTEKGKKDYLTVLVVGDRNNIKKKQTQNLSGRFPVSGVLVGIRRARF